MKIYFVGTHSTGKTTLARYVAKKHNIPMLTEVARSVLTELETTLSELRTNVDLVNEYQKKVFYDQIKLEDQFKDNFVSDRAFDNLAYAAEHSTVLYTLIHSPEFKKYIDSVRQGLVFYIRPDKSLLKEDGVREASNWEAAIRIDGMIKFMLEQYSILYVPINTTSMQERTRLVNYIISGKEE